MIAIETRVEVWRTTNTAGPAPVEEYYVVAVVGDELVLAAKGPFEEGDAASAAADPEGFLRALAEEATQKLWVEAAFVKEHRGQFERVAPDTTV